MDEEWRPGTGTRSVASIVRVAAADEGENALGKQTQCVTPVAHMRGRQDPGRVSQSSLQTKRNSFMYGWNHELIST